MHFDSSTNKTDKCFLATNNGLIKSKNDINHLEVFIDYKLSWKYHINHVVKQTSFANFYFQFWAFWDIMHHYPF